MVQSRRSFEFDQEEFKIIITKKGMQKMAPIGAIFNF